MLMTSCCICKSTPAMWYYDTFVGAKTLKMYCATCIFNKFSSDDSIELMIASAEPCVVCNIINVNNEYEFRCEVCHKSVCCYKCARVFTCQSADVICNNCWKGLCPRCNLKPPAIKADQYITDDDPKPYCGTCCSIIERENNGE
jgi:hypothetical protein